MAPTVYEIAHRYLGSYSRRVHLSVTALFCVNGAAYLRYTESGQIDLEPNPAESLCAQYFAGP